MNLTAKKLLALALAVLMLFSIAACAKEELPTTPTDTKKKVVVTQNEKETEAPVQIDYWVDLVRGGKPCYTVVSANAKYDKIAKKLAEDLTLKTGVSFSFYSNNTSSGKKIMVGSNPDSVLSNSNDLTYNGQVALYTDSHIYLMGFTEEGIMRAVNRFQSNILDDYVLTDEDGEIEVKIPNTVFFFHNPDNYSNTTPTIFGHDLADYQIVFPKDMSMTEQFAARYVISALGSGTGLKLKYVTDEKPEAAREIVFGKTNRTQSQQLYSELGDHEFVMKSVGDSIYVGYEEFLSLYEIRQKICSWLMSDPTEALAVTETYGAEILDKPDPSGVRVMTTNIVCAGDLNGVETFLEGLGITWEERVGLQADMIMDYLPDFVGMQEMQEHGNVNGYAGFMHTAMKEGTAGEYSFVEYEGLPASNYWTPIMYRSTVWKVEDKGYGQPFDAGHMHRWQWALFSKLDDPSERYILINLHNPTGNNQDAQQAAAESVNNLFLDLEYAYPDAPIFITGDFNATIGSPTLNKTLLGTDLKAAYQMSQDNGGQNFKGCIDLVLVQENLMDVERCRYVYTHQTEMTSDHRPVFADIVRKAE